MRKIISDEKQNVSRKKFKIVWVEDGPLELIEEERKARQDFVDLIAVELFNEGIEQAQKIGGYLPGHGTIFLLDCFLPVGERGRNSERYRTLTTMTSPTIIDWLEKNNYLRFVKDHSETIAGRDKFILAGFWLYRKIAQAARRAGAENRIRTVIYTAQEELRTSLLPFFDDADQTNGALALPFVIYYKSTKTELLSLLDECSRYLAEFRKQIFPSLTKVHILFNKILQIQSSNDLESMKEIVHEEVGNGWTCKTFFPMFCYNLKNAPSIVEARKSLDNIKMEIQGYSKYAMLKAAFECKEFRDVFHENTGNVPIQTIKKAEKYFNDSLSNIVHGDTKTEIASYFNVLKYCRASNEIKKAMNDKDKWRKMLELIRPSSLRLDKILKDEANIFEQIEYDLCGEGKEIFMDLNYFRKAVKSVLTEMKKISAQRIAIASDYRQGVYTYSIKDDGPGFSDSTQAVFRNPGKSMTNLIEALRGFGVLNCVSYSQEEHRKSEGDIFADIYLEEQYHGCESGTEFRLSFYTRRS